MQVKPITSFKILLLWHGHILFNYMILYFSLPLKTDELLLLKNNNLTYTYLISTQQKAYYKG